MQEELFTNGQTMHARIFSHEWTMHAMRFSRKRTMHAMRFSRKRTMHARIFFRELTNMRGDFFTNNRTCEACQSTSKGATCTCNIKQTLRLPKTLHTFSCRGEAMIHKEHIHHSATLQLDMDTTISMNIPTLSCRVMSVTSLL